MQKIAKNIRKGNEKMKKLLCLILTLASLFTVFYASAQAASISTGIEVLASETKLIKTGIIGRKLNFCDADFKQGLCLTDFDSVKITKIPASDEGALMLAGRRVTEGISIKRKNLGALVFIPASKEVITASFSFNISEYSSDSDVEFILKFIEKVNYEPFVDEGYLDALSLKTQSEVGVHGRLYATDNEGDEIEYIVITYPKYGTLSYLDKKSGEYIYTPNSGFVGNDSFTYVARDEYGNFSKTQTVDISVNARMCDVEYDDMTGRPEYNAAIAMTALGIMSGEFIGDENHFNPERKVTRAEFLAMAMKAVGMKKATVESYFDDNGDIPLPLRGYVATAQKAGIVNGKFTDGKLIFSPNDEIATYEASLIMARLTGARAEGEISAFSNESDIPVWARASVYAMCDIGVLDYNGVEIDALKTLTRAETATYLYRLISK